MLILDFETRSRCDLKQEGGYKYGADPSTEIICLAAYSRVTNTEWLWVPDDGPLPDALIAALSQDVFVVAHNAEFDREIYDNIGVPKHGFPPVPLERWYCSQAQCRVNALPASLEKAAWALGLSQQKLATGTHLIRKLSIPQKGGTFNRDPKLLREMAQYCEQDVRTTDAIISATRLMSPQEHQDWMLTVKMNMRGVRIDRVLATSALKYADVEQQAIADKLSTLTCGTITKHTQHIRIKNWVLQHTQRNSLVHQFAAVIKDGKKKQSMDKNVRSNILQAYNDDLLELSDELVELIQLVSDGNKSSVAKFKKMISLAGRDDRVRGAFIFAGASQTLRYTSRGLQLHNMRRECYPPGEAEALKATMARGAPLKHVMETLSKLLRPAIVPAPGNVFVVGDWSSIEARCLPWLSDSNGGRDKLRRFFNGEDIYLEAADAMGYPGERQTGKTAELACGYQGGYSAFLKMAKLFGLNIKVDAAKEIVKRWRKANKWAVNFWYQLEQAAYAAVSEPTRRFRAGKVFYQYHPELMNGTLVCEMPGENYIQYPMARIEDGELTALKSSYTPAGGDPEWPRVSIYGGLLAENCTQAFAAAILRDALRNLEDVVLHVHDEICLEVPASNAAQAATYLTEVMTTAPAWAAGLPLSMEPKVVSRYGK